MSELQVHPLPHILRNGEKTCPRCGQPWSVIFEGRVPCVPPDPPKQMETA